MGLLDSLLSDPDSSGLLGAGAAMFNASGPSIMPRSLGQVLAAGLTGAQQGVNSAQDQQGRQLEMASKKIALQQAVARLGYIQQLGQPDGSAVQGQPAIAPPSAASMPLGSGFTGMALAQPGDGQAAVSAHPGMPNMKAMIGLALLDNKISDAYGMQKDMATGFGRDAGKYYTMPDGSTQYLGDPTKGVTQDANGNVVQMPGASAALAGIAGATTAAQEAAKSNFTPVTFTPPGADSHPVTMTQAQQLALLRGGQPQPVQAPPIGDNGDPTAFSPASLDRIPPSVQAGRDNAAIKVAFDDIGNARTPEDKAQAMAAYKQMVARNAAGQSAITGTPIQGGNAAPQPALQSVPGMATQSPAEAAAALKQVNLAADPLIKFKTDLLSTAHAANAANLGKLSDTVRSEFEIQNRNKQLLPLLDKIQTGGFDPEGRIGLANALQTSGLVPDALKPKLGQWLANGDPTTGKVVENQLAAAGIKTMLDTLDKEGKPNRAIFEAIQNAQESVKSGNATLKQVFGLQKQLYDMHYQQEQDMSKGMAAPDYNPLTLQQQFSKNRNDSLQNTPAVTTPAPSTPASASQVMQAMPTPNASNKGKLLVEHDTGKRYRSNGLQWQEVK